jgi:Zn2+/Cd2+-exporting ATPase
MTDATLKQARYRITGMDCGGCAKKVETVVGKIPGMSGVSVSLAANALTVTHVDTAEVAAEVARRVSSLGYGIARVGAAPAAPHDAHDHGDHAGYDHGAQPAADKHTDHSGHSHGDEPDEPHDGPWWTAPKAKLIATCVAALAAAWLVAQIAPRYAIWFYAAAMMVGLYPIARRAYAAAINGAPFTIEMLMSIAAIGALLIGATEEAAVVVVLFLVGELLEGLAAQKARASIQSLASLAPKTAWVEADGKLTEVAAEKVAVGSILLVRPGDRIPADGEIVSGETSVNEAPVTGESTPRRKEVGANVLAGTINIEGAIRVRVMKAAADNTIARIVKLIESAQEAKAPTERFIDSFSHYYTPFVLLLGALVAVIPPLLFGGNWYDWIYKGLAVLLIGCPCALVISTPAAIASGLSAGARQGLLIKGGGVLETLGKVTTVAFDKTGTLTEGRPVVTDIVALTGTAQTLLADAAALDATSSHPIAKAILDRAAADKIVYVPAEQVAAVGGKGVAGQVGSRKLFLGSASSANAQVKLSDDATAKITALQEQGKTVSVLIADGAVSGLIAVRDEPRADAKAGIAALTARGVKSIMLTGDNARTGRAIGAALGMEVYADLLPEHKLKIVEERRAKGEIVAKVGDGINDAPALAAADVGIAVGGGTDVALETADAATLHGRVGDVAAMIDLSRATMSNIWQNIILSLGLKAVFLLTTVLGVTGLWPAILADTGATVLVTLNALRLLSFNPVRQN